MNVIQKAYDNEKERIFASASKFSEFVDETIKDSTGEYDQENNLEILCIASCVAGWAENGTIDWIVGDNVHNARVEELVNAVSDLIGKVDANMFGPPKGTTFRAHSVAGTYDDSHTYRALVITSGEAGSTGPTEIFVQWLS